MFWPFVYLALRRIFQLDVLALRHERTKGRCCVVAWWARFGAAVHSSDGEDEFSKGLRDPMPRIDIKAEFAAVEILDEGMVRADYPH